MNFWARLVFVLQWRHDSLIPPGDGPIIRRACMSTNRSIGTSVIRWQRRTHYIISGPSYVKLVSRRTARHATICHVDGLVNGTYSEREVLTVEITAAGTLNMILIIWLRFNTMNTVATKLDKKLECWMSDASFNPWYSNEIYTHASIKKMRPSVKIIWVRRPRPIKSRDVIPMSLYTFNKRTIKSKHIE